MRKGILILSCLLLALSTSVKAQKRAKKTPVKQLSGVNVDEAIRQYRFEDAIEALNHDIEILEEQSQSTEALEAQLEQAEKAQNRLNATEQIVFIDSVVVSRDEIYQHIYLSDEVGSVTSYYGFFGGEQNNESSVFLSQMKDKIIFSSTDGNGHSRLYSRDFVGNEWSEPSILKGLDDLDDTQQNYPYLLPDGFTLYFAAKGSESIGGYDIFQTRYDADEGCFLAPENIGMPFNSPANDYLYIVDDFSKLGYFVTDRNQAEGKVCIYTFVPNEVRKVHNSNVISASKLRSFAMLNSLRDTWKNNQNVVDEALTRLSQLKQESSSKTTSTFSKPFVLNDHIIILKATDLKQPEAQKVYGYWQEGQKQLEEIQHNLDQLRLQYSKANDDQKKTLSPTILNQEKAMRQLMESLSQQEKDIRRLENK